MVVYKATASDVISQSRCPDRAHSQVRELWAQNLAVSWVFHSATGDFNKAKDMACASVTDREIA